VVGEALTCWEKRPEQLIVSVVGQIALHCPRHHVYCVIGGLPYQPNRPPTPATVVPAKTNARVTSSAFLISFPFVGPWVSEVLLMIALTIALAIVHLQCPKQNSSW